MFLYQRSASLRAAVACAVLLCLFCVPRYAAAQMPDVMIDEAQKVVSDMSQRYQAIRAELEKADRDTWTVAQTHEYLDASLWVIYEGMTYYFMKNGSLPNTLEELKGSVYISTWPDNPFNDWKPIRILTLADSFSPGDVVWQICPPEFYSFIKNTRPVSCELSIYGPDVKYADFGDAKADKANKWAVVPEGAVFMLGQWCEPASVSAKKFEKDSVNK
jgi:hypothetical protein